MTCQDTGIGPINQHGSNYTTVFPNGELETKDLTGTKNLSSRYTSDKNDYTEENGLFRKFLKQNILDIPRTKNGEATTFIIITKIPQNKDI